MRSLRLLSFSLIGLLMLSTAVPVLAAEDEGAEGDNEVGIVSDYQPAVVVQPAGGDDIEPAWTTKFLVPTGLLIAAIALLSTVVMYFVRVVRTRYKVVE